MNNLSQADDLVLLSKSSASNKLQLLMEPNRGKPEVALRTIKKRSEACLQSGDDTSS